MPVTIKYTEPGRAARVDITADTAAGPEVLAHGRVARCFADRGLGIPTGQHEVIFGSFHRAHTDTAIPGTELGLAICRRITERHGGTITAQDNPGGGTRITATLPAVPDHHHPPQLRAEDLIVTERGRRTTVALAPLHTPIPVSPGTIVTARMPMQPELAAVGCRASTPLLVVTTPGATTHTYPADRVEITQRGAEGSAPKGALR